ncbi:GntR family transcriptional regulator [Cohnella ginsengisoli]|uniref:GntR family transcriptional regulator n=1 Tax=Cohnella ginsengisoli TaxID=425004 RepID=A0A9X4KJV7_9BACL|nr:GntR family transcriptional regulator [Cohnella ginsengisoli]MDG0793388.1 GntR family transcriptional regulator [Cohnella ginsengisoli]
MPDNPPSLNRYVLADELYALLKTRILSHEMSAGDKINIDKLARDLGVSNIPIREALSRLSSEGLVSVVPFKGMFVAAMNAKDIDEIFEIRLSLESLALSKAAARIPKDRLRQILAETKAPQEDADANQESASRMFKMNEGLHGTILAYADNENLQRMVVSLIERIYRYLNLLNFAIALADEREEHVRILNALLADDMDEAGAALELHLQRARQRLRDSFN